MPTDRRNLVWRAAELLAEHAGVRADAQLEIAKSIPAAAGLAGGSADAAAALVALDALWGTRADRDDLLGLAARLGSDVPFSLLGGVALGTGRGEQLTPVLARPPWHLVLGIAGEGLSTPSVYAELDRLRAAGRVPDGTRPAPGRAGDRGAAQRTGRGAGRRAGQRPAGAGAGAAARARARAAGGGRGGRARRAGERLRARPSRRWPRTGRPPCGWPRRSPGEGVFRTLRAVSGPVPGARLVG